ncbi:MAG: TIGR04283 family arsenosugar biosynthesis glycosyltransferase [Flavobacteriales bacterium]|nr:TIGR04283 family arsenosugar biosynthesis glycosyltransferase [Flavobacteriales bacterium]
MKLSIIIPTYNEAQYIGRLLDRIISEQDTNTEIIVVDGGSEDETLKIVSNRDVIVFNSDLSRAVQMNVGAEKARGEVLYFVHADTLPPVGFLKDINEALNEGCIAATYRSKFDSGKWLLKINEFFTRFNRLYCRGGDQSLMIKKEFFDELGRFDESLKIMEEYPLIKRLMDSKRLKVFDKTILISSRKYEQNSWLKVNLANLKAYKMFKRGEDSLKIKETYCQKLQSPDV